LIAEQLDAESVGVGTSRDRMLRQNALLISASARDAHGAIRFGHAISDTGSAMDRRRIQRQWRFHDEMQPSIRPDQQSEVIWLRAVVRPGNVKNPLRVLKESIH
jgi:hypothetical protein